MKKFRFGSLEYDFSSRTYIMGVLNVTPDSFSDGGKYFDIDSAVARGLQIEEEGADIIDIGGESTRPGSNPISSDEECNRVIPVIERLVKKISIPISIDTYKSVVADAALKAGAMIVNDISGLRYDKLMANVVAKNNASVILMHIKNTPKTMQENPEYSDVIEEICSYLNTSIQQAKSHGIEQIIVDPGIGFGKKLEHNLIILKNLSSFKRFGYPLLVGPSRKSFIGMILNTSVDERFEGTAASVAVSIIQGANIIRVHDVKAMKRVAQVTDAIIRS